MTKQNCVMLSDYFHIVYDDKGIITQLAPDLHNPEMKNFKKENFIKIFIQDEMDNFCKQHHIPKFLWKKYGCIIQPPAELDYQLIGFQFKFLWITFVESIKISTTLLMFLH